MTPSSGLNLRPALTLNPDPSTGAHGPNWRWLDWPVAGVRAGYSLRHSGVSAAPWDSFNLGDHVGDDPGAVAANRDQLTRTLGVRPVFLRQVHGWGVQALPCADGTEADAVMAEQLGILVNAEFKYAEDPAHAKLTDDETKALLAGLAKSLGPQSPARKR